MKGIDNTSLDQILFTMSQPIRGSDPGQIINYIIDPLLEAFLITVPLATLLYFATTCSFKFGSIYLQRQPHFKTKKSGCSWFDWFDFWDIFRWKRDRLR